MTMVMAVMVFNDNKSHEEEHDNGDCVLVKGKYIYIFNDRSNEDKKIT